MDTQTTTNNALNKDKKLEKTRRVWTRREEEVLMGALKNAISCGWKSGNGFRCGYLVFLEDALKKVFLSTDLCGNPHINSKIHVWKKIDASFTTLLSKSGSGWNDTDKTIDAMDEAWEAFVKCDNSVRGMRHKPWPYYHEWCEIFGNDRDTGENAQSFVDAVQDVLNFDKLTSLTQDKNVGDFSDFGELMSTTTPLVAESSQTNKSISKKCKYKEVAQDKFVDAMNRFTDMTRDTMSDLTMQFGYKREMMKETTEVFEALGRLPNLTEDDQVLAAEILVEKLKKLALFSFPENARCKLVKRLLTSV